MIRFGLTLAASLVAALLAKPAVATTQSSSSSGAEETRATLVAERLQEGERLELDGVLDEPAWQRAVPITDFRQREPSEGALPTEETEVRILFDDDNLYIGAILHDSEPDRILAHQRERNASLGTDDRFMWILDTFLDGRSGYFFEINPAGLKGDGLIRPGAASGGANRSWDGIWEARVARGDYGWSAEIRIPFRTLNFDPGLDTWGINFQRTVRRKNEEIVWSGHLQNQSLFSPVHAGLLTGLEDISQGLGIEVKPFVTSSRNVDAQGTTSPSDLGVDVSYSLTPSLRASVTINTDFAEVEVDQRRVNLTRFPVSYPERRDFFLEGSGVFSFAPGNGVQPFFSRRIGLTGGEPVPIQHGTRLAGQIGANDLGLYQVRTGGTGTLAAEDFTAARVVRNFLEQSSVGFLYTRRGTHEAGVGARTFGSHTLASDLELATSRFRGDRNLLFQAFAVAHSPVLGDTSSAAADRSAHGMRLAYLNDPWVLRTSYRELGRHFDPALGFHARRGFRRVQPTIGYSPRLADHPLVRQLEFQLRHEYLMDLEFQPLTVSSDLTLLGVRFHSGDNFSLDVGRETERLGRSFEIHDGIVVPAGEYTVSSWQVSARSAGYRTLAANLNVSGGQFWSGQRTRVRSGLTLRPAPGLNLGTNWEHNDVRLEEGSFQANLVRLNAGWHLNPSTSLTGNVQYDNLSELVGLYARVRWIVRPGSDLYLVYTHNWLHAERELMTLSRSGATKLTYTHRF